MIKSTNGEIRVKENENMHLQMHLNLVNYEFV